MSRPDPDRIGFRPVEPGDFALLARWLQTPHWREWWGEPETELSYIRDMVEGRDDTCEPFIATLDREPAAYVQVWRVAPHQTPGWIAQSPWLAELPAEAVGVDLSLGEGVPLGRGVGSAILARFVSRLRAEGHGTIVIDPDPANRRAVAAYARAGFRPISALEGRFDGVLIMQHHPDA